MVVYYDVVEKEVDVELKEILFLKSSYVFNRCQVATYLPPTEEATNELGPCFERIE